MKLGTILFILVLTTPGLANSGEHARRPGENPYIGWAYQTDYPTNLDYNKWLYSLGKSYAEIMGSQSLSEEERQIKAANLCVPGDKVILKIVATNITEKEIQGKKAYQLEAEINYGEAGLHPVKCVIFSLRHPKEISPLYPNQPVSLKCIITRVSFAGKLTPTLTVRCATQETVEWLGTINPNIK